MNKLVTDETGQSISRIATGHVDAVGDRHLGTERNDGVADRRIVEQ